MLRFFIHTFGCQMNVHDSRRIAEVLTNAHHQATDELDNADLIIFNTCSVRDKAEHKLVSAVGALRTLKESRPNLMIAIAGCMAQQHKERLLKKLKLIDLVIGPDNIQEFPNLIEQLKSDKGPVVRTCFDESDPKFLRARVRKDEREVTSYVTIMKGCDERCAFCIVPHTRGFERYRKRHDILQEIEGLVAGGVREITLLGQTVNSWHEPDGENRKSKFDFAQLLRSIDKSIPDLLRLRYTAPHPRHLTPDLIRAHAELDLLPWHVHLPVQSGSDRVLKRMIRRYKRSEYVKMAQALQNARPGLTMSTDFIVGFPGETKEDFQQTLSLVSEIGFVSAFAFKYSPRPFTPALKLGDDVEEAVKDERLSELLKLIEDQKYTHHKRLVGTKTKVLLEEPNSKTTNHYTGRSHRHEIVHVECPEGANLTGQLVEVCIEQANRNSLMGTLTEEQMNVLLY